MRIYYDTTEQADATNTIFPLERARMLSAFEAVSATDQGGNSLYKDIRAGQGDEKFLKDAIQDGASVIEADLTAWLAQPAAYAGTYVELTPLERYEANDTTSLADRISQALSHYALWRWLADKLSDRAADHANLWTSARQLITQAAYHQAEPTPTV